MRKVLPLLSAVLILGATAAAVSAQGKDWGGLPPHGHVMLMGASTDGEHIYFTRCVEFAAARALPKTAHHDSVHTGAAGGSPFLPTPGALGRTGKWVVPLSPLVPFDWHGCESFESGMDVPE